MNYRTAEVLHMYNILIAPFDITPFDIIRVLEHYL